MKNVLIFYVTKHSGHFHAANAIEKGLMKVVKGIHVEKINALSYTNPILEKILNKAYMRVIKKNPEFWGNIYDDPGVMEKTRMARESLLRFNMPKTKKLIEDYSPDAVFCTQAFPCGMMADYKRSCGIKDILLIGVLTDYAPHSYWLHDEVDCYVVPSEETGQVLEGKGVPRSKVKVYGIPVDPKFRIKHDVSNVKRNLGLRDDDPVVLIMGGSQGLGAIPDIVKLLLLKSGPEYQMVVVTGANKKLFSRLQRMTKKENNKDLHVLSYIDNVDELMEVADIIVTKAGGMTVAEALVKNLPMLIVDPIPGHERMNTDYLVSEGAAIEVRDRTRIHETIDELFSSGKTLTDMRANIEKLATPESSLNIAKLVFSDEKGV